MKTLQEYVKELDRERLIQEICWVDKIDFIMLENKDISVAEVFARQRGVVSSFLEAFEKIEPVKNDNGIFLACPSDDPLERIWVFLIHADELGEEKPVHYDVCFVDRNKLAGFLVAGTEYVQDHIYEVVADIIKEATFWGWSESAFIERRAEVKKELDAALKEVDEDKCRPISTIFESLGLPPKKVDPEEERLRFECIRKNNEFLRYVETREINNRKKCLSAPTD